MSLARTLWQEAEATAQRCLDHPFVQGIGNGSLPVECYRIFIAQDAFYLDVFARGYEHCAEVAPDAGGAEAFRRMRAGVASELELHRATAERLAIDLDRVQPLPSTLAYTGFLEECIERGLSAGLTAASMAPCMRLYAFLGARLAASGGDPGAYRDWVESYASAEMEALAQRNEGLIDRYVGAEEREEARRRYHRAMDLEYAFFDGAWRAGSATATEGVEALIDAHRDEWEASTSGAAFIEGVRTGALNEAVFARWLVQDRLFVLGLVDAQRAMAEHMDGDAKRVLLDGVRGLEDELEWFVQQGTARKLNLEVAPVKDCSAFVAYLHSLRTAPSAVALTAIWTTERAYRDAWSAARPGAPAYREYVEHWSNDEFRAYVDALREAADAALASADAREREAAAEAFCRVMGFERRFWLMTGQEA